jgi:hypothetical protein
VALSLRRRFVDRLAIDRIQQVPGEKLTCKIACEVTPIPTIQVFESDRFAGNQPVRLLRIGAEARLSSRTMEIDENPLRSPPRRAGRLAVSGRYSAPVPSRIDAYAATGVGRSGRRLPAIEGEIIPGAQDEGYDACKYDYAHGRSPELYLLCNFISFSVAVQ